VKLEQTVKGEFRNTQMDRAGKEGRFEGRNHAVETRLEKKQTLRGETLSIGGEKRDTSKDPKKGGCPRKKRIKKKKMVLSNTLEKVSKRWN